MTHEFASIPKIALYGDVMLRTATPAILSPRAHYAESISLSGRLPASIPQKHRDNIWISEKSSLAQLGLEIANLQMLHNLLQVELINVGPYAVSFLGNAQYNLGAISTVGENDLSRKDAIAYLDLVLRQNAHLDKQSIRLLDIKKPAIWFETSTLLGPAAPPDPNKPVRVDKIPRGSEREKIAKALDRIEIASAKEGVKHSYVDHETAYCILQTPGYILPVDGFGFVIDGFTVLDSDGSIISTGLHGESRLVAQPGENREIHNVLAEVHEDAPSIIDLWGRKQRRIGYHGHPVRII